MTEVLVLGLQNFNKITSILLYQKNGCEGRMKVMVVMLHLTQIQFCEREKRTRFVKTRPVMMMIVISPIVSQ